MVTSSNSLRLRVNPHEGQRKVLESQAFCTAAIAGTGGGKTVAGMVWLALQMAKNPGQMWIAVEPFEDMVERNLVTSTPSRMSLVDLLARFDPSQVYLRSKGIIRNALGTVFLMNAENPGAMQGAHVAGVWLDEAGLMKMEAFLVALQRVGYEGGRLLLTTTPYDMGWLKRLVYDRWADGDRDYSVSKFPSTANPRYSKEAVERARRTMSAARFRMMYEGDFGRPEGMIYDCFDEARNLVDAFDVPADWLRVGGVDFGFNNPTAGAMLARSPDGVWYLYAEHYQREATLAINATALKGKGAGTSVWYCDPAGKQQTLELQRLGMPAQWADNDVRAGIDTVYSLLAQGRLKVFRSLTYTLAELGGYRWVKDPGGMGLRDEPVKRDDHLMDALRYALQSTEKGARLQLVT